MTRHPFRKKDLAFFDEFFNELLDNKETEIAKAAKEIKEEAKRRRAASKKKANRPTKYQYYGLEERVTTIYPEGVNIDECGPIRLNVML